MSAHLACQATRRPFAGTYLAAMIAAVALLSAAAGGCSGSGEAHPPTEEAFASLQDEPVDQVVARVDGRAVSLEEFEAFWRDHPEMSRQQALDALIDRELLVGEAIRRGVPASKDLQFARKRAMVRQLLERQVEDEVQREDLSDSEVAERVDKIRHSVGHPPGMRASHILVTVPRKAKKKASKEQVDKWYAEAKRWLGAIRDELPEAPGALDLLAARDRFKGQVPEPLDVVVNAHLTFPIGDPAEYGRDYPEGWRPVVPAFRDAAAQMARQGRLGELSDPVKTQFGWHLIVGEELLDAEVGDPKAARQVAIAQLLRQKRQEKLVEKMKQWLSSATVETYPGVITEADKKEN